MRPVVFAIGWVFLMLAVILAAASISHDSTYIFAVEFIAIAALAWSLGGPRWAFGAVAAVALMLLFSYAFCCMAAVSDGCGLDDSEGK